jgi:glycoside/pentoside/hexuronide:cation symporter, GPH family
MTDEELSDPENERPGSDASEKLPLAVKLAFGFPTFPGIAMALPIGIFMTKFYTDTVGVALGFIALAQVLARSVDAITDPLMGWLSDRTRTPWGRRRPWMLLGAPLAAVALVALFGPPVGVDALTGAAWFTTAYITYYIFQTIYQIPHFGLGPELTSDYHERSSLFAWRDGFGLAGVAFSTAVPAILVASLKARGATDAEAQRAAFFWFACAMAFLLVAAYAWLCYRVQENPTFSVKKSNPLIPGVRRVFRVKPFRILLGCYLISSVTAQLFGMLMPFYLQYALGVESWLEVTGIAMFLSYALGLVTLPVWVRFAKHHGKKTMWIASFALLFIFDLSLFALPSFVTGEAAGWLVIGIFPFRGVGMAGGQFLAPSIQADVIDYDELHTGQRREAQYAALWSIVTKLAVIPSLSIPLTVLAALGFEPNVEQSEAVRWTIRVLYGLAPAIMVVVAIYLIYRFPIDETVHRGTLAGVDAHRRGERARDPITGHDLAPPMDRGIDEKTGWLFDHFSTGELSRASRAGSQPGHSLRRDTSMMLVLSVLLLILSAVAAWQSVPDLDSRPGLLTLTSVMLAGIGFTGTIFHSVRLHAAWQIRAFPSELVPRHLENVTLLKPMGPGSA